MVAAEPARDYAEYVDIYEAIRAGLPHGLEALYAKVRKARYYLYSLLGPRDLDDHLHDCFMAAVMAIRERGLHTPERLMGFVRGIIGRHILIEIARRERNHKRPDKKYHEPSDPAPGPLEILLQHQEQDAMLEALRSLRDTEQEILTRYYLMEQKTEDICREMQLSPTQFKMRKMRCMTKFAGLGRKQARNNLLVEDRRRMFY